MKIKKLSVIALLLALVMLVGCGNQTPTVVKVEAPAATAPTETAAPAVSEAPAASEAPATEAPAPVQKPKGEVPSASTSVFSMDTIMTITCWGDRCEEAIEAATAEIYRLNALLSVGDEKSEISMVNAAGNGILSPESQLMVKKALQIYETTGGAFDITVYPLMELWGFTSGNMAVPNEEKLQKVLADVGADKLNFDDENGEIILGPRQGIDLGGIAKGFTSDRLMDIFADYDLVAGIVSLGGNIECYGTKVDGSLWKCGIRSPFEPENPYSLYGILSTTATSIITSGAYERNFTENGVLYHHIIDPKTGKPSNSGLASVTIVSRSGVLADGLSTACYVLGLEGATKYWQEYGEEFGFDLILIADDGTVYVTEPISENFTSDYPTVVIR